MYVKKSLQNDCYKGRICGTRLELFKHPLHPFPAHYFLQSISPQPLIMLVIVLSIFLLLQLGKIATLSLSISSDRQRLLDPEPSSRTRQFASNRPCSRRKTSAKDPKTGQVSILHGTLGRIFAVIVFYVLH